jgi:hypothetical protein
LGAAPPLGAARGVLPLLRSEAEERTLALAAVASECKEEVQRCQEQIRTSTSAMAAELSALRKEREATAVRAEGLRMRREELLDQLRAVSEELTDAEALRERLDVRDRHLQDSMERVSGELAQQLDGVEEHGLVASQRQQLLQSSCAIAKAVEAQLAVRAVAAEEASAACRKLGVQEPLVGATCLASDRARCAELSELLAAWHEAIWGPEAGVQLRDARYASQLRAAHLRALGTVEDAVREAEQIVAASSAGTFEGLLNRSPSCKDGERSAAEQKQQMGRAAKYYKEARQQLKENLNRLLEVETHCGPADGGCGPLGSATPQKFGRRQSGDLPETITTHRIIDAEPCVFSEQCQRGLKIVGQPGSDGI